MKKKLKIQLKSVFLGCLLCVNITLVHLLSLGAVLIIQVSIKETNKEKVASATKII